MNFFIFAFLENFLTHWTTLSPPLPQRLRCCQGSCTQALPVAPHLSWNMCSHCWGPHGHCFWESCDQAQSFTPTFPGNAHALPLLLDAASTSLGVTATEEGPATRYIPLSALPHGSVSLPSYWWPGATQMCHPFPPPPWKQHVPAQPKSRG